MTYDQAVCIVKAAMKSGSGVKVYELDELEGFAVHLDCSGSTSATYDFAVAVAQLPAGSKVWR